MSYLEQLKKESQERHKQETLKTQKAQNQKIQRTKSFQTKVKPALEQLQRALRELTEHVNYLKPDTKATYEIKGYGEIDDFQQQDYRVALLDNISGTSISKANTDDNDTCSNFILRCFCETEYKYRLIKDTIAAANLQRKFFTHNQIAFDYKEEADEQQRFTRAVFLFKPKIQVLFEFVGNFETSSIDLTVTNFEELGNKKVYTLQPDEINKSFLDNLATYILREAHQLVLREKNGTQPQKIGKSPKSPKLTQPNNRTSKGQDTQQSGVTTTPDKTSDKSPSSTFGDQLSVAQTKVKTKSETKSKKSLFGFFKKK